MKSSLKTLILIIVLLLPSVAFSGVSATSHQSASTFSNVSETELDIYALINRERTRRKLSLLVWDDRLADLARSYSRQMASQEFFGHSDPNGHMVQDRVWNARLYTWKKVGENLFWVQDRDDFRQLAIQRWMDSPSHRENILDHTWTSTGIGIWLAPNGRHYVTQVFLSE